MLRHKYHRHLLVYSLFTIITPVILAGLWVAMWRSAIIDDGWIFFIWALPYFIFVYTRIVIEGSPFPAQKAWVERNTELLKLFFRCFFWGGAVAAFLIYISMEGYLLNHGYVKEHRHSYSKGSSPWYYRKLPDNKD